MSQSSTFNPVEDAKLKAEVPSIRELHPAGSSKGQDDRKSRLSWSWIVRWIEDLNTGAHGPGSVRKRVNTENYQTTSYVKWSTGKMRTKEPSPGLINNLKAFVNAHRDFTNAATARLAIREAKKTEAEARKNEAAGAAAGHCSPASADGEPCSSRTTRLHSSENARRGCPILKPERPGWV